MSKETYDIFEEDEKEVPMMKDKVQKAVDLYVKEHKQFPMLQYEPLNRINYYPLLQAHCLDAQPDIELYKTNYYGLVTHRKPKRIAQEIDIAIPVIGVFFCLTILKQYTY